MKFNYTSISKIGLKRFDNEDSVGVFETNNGLLAIVCDGLGGNNAGEVASQLTVQTIFDVFSNSTELDFLERIKLSIKEANKKVLLKSSEDADLKGMATTVEVLFLKDNTAFWGHVGDSRIYNLKNGKLKQLTKDHSLVQKLIDEGYLTLKEAENHPNKNVIMRALGDNKMLDIDVSKTKIGSNGNVKFFLCTDGVTTVIKDFELQDLINQNDISTAVRQLSQLIEDRGAPDNYSFVIIELTD